MIKIDLFFENYACLYYIYYLTCCFYLHMSKIVIIQGYHRIDNPVELMKTIYIGMLWGFNNLSISPDDQSVFPIRFHPWQTKKFPGLKPPALFFIFISIPIHITISIFIPIPIPVSIPVPVFMLEICFVDTCVYVCVCLSHALLAFLPYAKHFAALV